MTEVRLTAVSQYGLAATFTKAPPEPDLYVEMPTSAYTGLFVQPAPAVTHIAVDVDQAGVSQWLAHGLPVHDRAVEQRARTEVSVGVVQDRIGVPDLQGLTDRCADDVWLESALAVVQYQGARRAAEGGERPTAIDRRNAGRLGEAPGRARYGRQNLSLSLCLCLSLPEAGD